MKLGGIVASLAFALSLAAGYAAAAIREPSSEPAPRVFADARAEQALPAAPAMQAAPTLAPEPVRDDAVRRDWVERSNMLSARFDEIDAKIYEIVGRLQLLAGCLIALFLGMALWQISIARQIAQLKGARQIEASGGLR